MWLMLLVVGCGRGEAPKECPVCDDCSDQVQKALEQQAGLDQQAVSIEDGPWLIKTIVNNQVSTEPQGIVGAVRKQPGVEVYQPTTEAPFPFLSETVGWKVAVASNINTMQCSGGRCRASRLSYSKAQAKEAVPDPCATAGSCVSIETPTDTAQGYHSDGVYTVVVTKNGTAMLHPAYYEVQTKGGVWNEAVHTKDGMDIPWPSDDTGKLVEWTIMPTPDEIPDDYEVHTWYTVSPY